MKKISCLISRHHKLCSREKFVKLHEYFNLSPSHSSSRLFPKSVGLSCPAKSDCEGGAKIGTTDCDGGGAKIGTPD